MSLYLLISHLSIELIKVHEPCTQDNFGKQKYFITERTGVATQICACVRRMFNFNIGGGTGYPERGVLWRQFLYLPQYRIVDCEIFQELWQNHCNSFLFNSSFLYYVYVYYV